MDKTGRDRQTDRRETDKEGSKKEKRQIDREKKRQKWVVSVVVVSADISVTH